MHHDHRRSTDITPRPAEFELPGPPPGRARVARSEITVTTLTLVALAVAVVVLADPWVRLATVSALVGALAAFAAARLARPRRARGWPVSRQGRRVADLRDPGSDRQRRR